MIRVVDIAEVILHELEYSTTMKLQKLTYYSQVYSLVKFGKPLFEEDFQAWVNGPVCPRLYERHRKKFMVSDGELRPTAPKEIKELNCDQKESIYAVLDKLGSFSGKRLSDLTHAEDPWKNHRKGYAPDERSEEIISKEEMKTYYSLPEIQATHVLFS